jgi:hypothetical protein
MFQLSAEEFGNLKSQFVMSSGGHGGRRKRPVVFTEQGIAMLSGVLRSDRAIAVNIEIMRAFIELRRVAGPFQGGSRSGLTRWNLTSERASASTMSNYARSSRCCGS